jgi:NAD(P)-dependent dehydrogenase (short-subunit alcohol dehydrogenase family)
MDLGLSGAVAVVTGGASGIGRATAKLLAVEGAKVAVLDRSEAAGDATAGELSTDGADAMAVTCDVTDEASVTAAMAAVAARWGVIDHLVCCAGISVLYGKTIEEVQVREWDDVMGVNVKGQWLPTKHALPYLRGSRNGSITFVASDSALVAAPHDVAYCTSKGAVLMFAKALSVDLQADGIRVNCVCPSIVDTPMSRLALGLGDEGFTNFGCPIQKPDDIARYLVLLASPVTSTINGHALVADFGYLAMSSFPA